MDVKKKIVGQYLSDFQFALILIVPCFIVMGLIIVYPLFRAVFMSFTDYNLLRPQFGWVGLQNYLNWFSNEIFWEVLLNTVLFSLSSVGLSLIVGLVLALLLNRDIVGRRFFRGAILMIWIVPWVVVSFLWLYMFNPNYGLFNYLLYRLGIIDEFLPWFAQPNLAKMSILIVYSWRSIPFMMIMLLAGLQTIPNDVIDAAEIDGAGAIARFRWVTIPYLKQILLIVFLLQTIRLFQEFTLIYLLTGGGPIYATTTLSIHVYQTAFQSYEMGTASAIGVTWLIFLMVFGFLYIKIITKKEI